MIKVINNDVLEVVFNEGKALFTVHLYSRLTKIDMMPLHLRWISEMIMKGDSPGYRTNISDNGMFCIEIPTNETMCLTEDEFMNWLSRDSKKILHAVDTEGGLMNYYFSNQLKREAVKSSNSDYDYEPNYR